eukprot:gb/GEZN01013599.1/.p2 GENE.gb/GEZN01013599.1/~~gb/GEZN01013599.1/.p2  ORF type:complete len:108 (+),score=20.17 gb/GEZN01013599.1/:113-436(+)
MPPKRKAEKEEEGYVEARSRTSKKAKLKRTMATSQLDFLHADENQLRRMFRVYDRDEDGHITAKELAAMLRSTGRRPLSCKTQMILDECGKKKERNSRRGRVGCLLG